MALHATVRYVTAGPVWPTTPGTPITITAGGTYSGLYVSTNPAVPAVLIATTAPVILDHARIEYVNIGVETTFNHLANLTVTDCMLLQLDPGVTSSDRAIYSFKAQTLVVEYCDLVDGNGIRWDGGNTSVVGGRFRYNRIYNVGRYGTGGLVQFLQCSIISFPNGLEVAWNHVQNTPLLTEVEDVINMYAANGAAGNVIDIHHNLVDGSFRPPTIGSYGHTGTGILLGDGTPEGNSGSYQRAHHNTCVRTLNAGLSCPGGDNMEIDNNVVVVSGLINTHPSGPDYGNGLSFWDYPAYTGTPTNGSVHDNLVGYNRFVDGELERSDYFVPQCGVNGNVCADNLSMDQPVTLVEENAAADAWDAAREAAEVTVGPRR